MGSVACQTAGDEAHESMVSEKYLGARGYFARWPSTNINWCYRSTGAPSAFSNDAAAIDIVRRATKMWEANSALRFRRLDIGECGNGEADGRIDIVWEALPSVTARADPKTDTIGPGVAFFGYSPIKFAKIELNSRSNLFSRNLSVWTSQEDWERELIHWSSSGNESMKSWISR